MFIPVLYWIGATSPWYLAALGAAPAVTCGTMALATRYPGWRPLLIAGLVLNVCCNAIVAWETSPFLVAPGIAAITATGFSFHPMFARTAYTWVVAFAFAVLAVVVPFALEQLGATTTTLATADGHLVITPIAVTVHTPHAQIALVIYTLFVIGAGSLIGRTISKTQWELRCQVQLHAWHLRQLVPTS